MSSQYVECQCCHILIEVNLTAMQMREFEQVRLLPGEISSEDRDLLLTDLCVDCWDVNNTYIDDQT